MNHSTLHAFHTRTCLRLYPGLYRFHDELSAAPVVTARAPLTAQIALNPAPRALVPLLLPGLARIQAGGPTMADHGGRDA